MTIIKKSSGKTVKIIGKQEITEGIRYRSLVYVDVVEIDGKWIACNYLTRCIIQISDDEKEILSNGTTDLLLAKELIDNWFLVPEDFDDYKLCVETRAFLKAFSRIRKDKKYIVMTTLDCNARCFYCYQMGRNKNRIAMSCETANAVADYIIKGNEGEKVSIQWYGGEPLYNSDVIDIISNRLKEAKIEYSSKMISNGYLLSKDVTDKAIKDWKLEFVNIPIDGSEAVYNKVKAYIYKDAGSAFQIVMDNIKYALESGIFIVVRVNFDQHNKEDIFKLAKELHTRFGSYNNFAIYSDILYENAGPKNPIRAAEERMQLVTTMIDFENYCMELGLNVSGHFNDTILIYRCMADGDNSVVISPDGRLGKCDHCMETKTHGSVFSDEIDKEMLASFKEVINTKESCEHCPMLPNCIRLANCPDDGDPICDDSYKLERKHHALVSLKNEYHRIMQKERI